MLIITIITIIVIIIVIVIIINLIIIIIIIVSTAIDQQSHQLNQKFNNFQTGYGCFFLVIMTNMLWQCQKNFTHAIYLRSDYAPCVYLSDDYDPNIIFARCTSCCNAGLA